MKEEIKSIAIIGGGYAGLSLGAILSTHGIKVQLYEAHTYLGGCASYFKRHHFTFDCGATTLSGLNHGRPLYKLCQLSGVDLDFLTLSTPMKIHFENGRSLLRFSDHEKFLEELCRVFPGIPKDVQRTFWEGLKKIEKQLWEILSASQYFPPKNFSDLFSLAKGRKFNDFSLGLKAFYPLKKIIPKEILNNRDYLKFIDEQLLISTQAKSCQAPILLSAMGLLYPEDMHYTPGGISRLAYKCREVIERNGGEVNLRHKVSKVIPSKEDHLYSLIIQAPGRKVIKREYSHVVSNLTIWDTPKLFPKDVRDKFPLTEGRGAWGAITAYFAIRTKLPILPLYHQVHLDEGSFFYSFSHPTDETRAPKGWQTVTLSTHTNVEDWLNLEEGTYEKKKRDFLTKILKNFKMIFDEYGILEIDKAEVGCPRTFQRFTHRHNGLVGGLPHNGKNHILNFPKQETPLKNFYQIGDTTFPGQGIVGVTTGAFILAGKLLGKNLLEEI